MKFHGIELITDEKKVIGLLTQEDCRKEFFKEYEPLKIEDCKLRVKQSEKESKKRSELVVSHPDLEYYISPYLLGIVHQFLETHFNQVHVLAVRKKPYPFLFRAAEIREDYNGCAFIVAPVVF